MTSQMRREIEEIPEAVSRLVGSEMSARIEVAAAAMRARDPAFMVTVARGSSDHACTFLKYASELMLGLPVASIGPSVASIYDAPRRLSGAVCLSVSQSGASPDIVAMTRAAGASGALTLALTNSEDSALAQVADHVLPVAAGPERSVAATKSFLNSCVAGLALLAEVAGDVALKVALAELPEALARAITCDWSPLAAALSSESVYVLGRGPSWAMAGEAALKFKEVAQVHAESYSSAEVLHGPVSLVAPGFPVLALAAQDAAEAGVAEVADALTSMGASVFATSELCARAMSLPVARAHHPLLDPLCLIVSFYVMVEAMAKARGLDPDAPPRLRKVTQTR
ncbi:MAG: SIS domain-containing protein [Pseudomonadota bacterium]